MSIENFVTLRLPEPIKRPNPEVKAEKDEGMGKESFTEKVLRTKLSKKIISFGVAGLIAVTPVAAAEVDLSQKETIVTKGEMPSQKELVIENQKEKEIIDQRFKSYLKEEEKYSEEELKKRLFYSYNTKDKADLGFCGLNGIETVVQGVLLGHFFQNNKDYVAIGTKNKEEDRIISLVEWPVTETMEAYKDVAVIEMVGGSSSTRYSIKSLTTRDEVDLFISERMGGVVLFNFFNITGKDLKSSGFMGLDDEKTNFYLNTVVPRISNNTELIAGLLMPTKDDQKRMRLDEVNYINHLSTGKQTNSIKNLSDVNTILDNNSENLPLLSYIAYNRYIH